MLVDPSDLPAIIEMYVQSRIRAGRPVSTAEGIRALRAVLPEGSGDDQDLANLIAASAVRNKQPVIFDLWGGG